MSCATGEGATVEPISRVPETDEHKLSRRTVVAGIAWSVPVIAIATATPAFASSLGPVTVLPTTYFKSGGTLIQSSGTGFLPSASDYILASKAPDGSFTSGSDTNGQAVTITAVYDFDAVKGAKYSISIGVIAQYGLYRNSTQYSERQSLAASIIQGGTSTKLAKVSVSHTNRCTNSDSTMKSAGYTLQTPTEGTKTYSLTYTATATGAVTIQCLFTLDARRSTNYTNDDMRVSFPVVARIS